MKNKLCWISICFALLCLTASAHAREPNIVFILADDLGYGDVGCYGQKQIQTPNIDRTAKERMHCTNLYARTTACPPAPVLPRALGAPENGPPARAAAPERHEIGLEPLADVLVVVLGERRIVERPQVHRHQPQLLGLETADHLADEATLHGVGLEQDECAISHGRARYRP